MGRFMFRQGAEVAGCEAMKFQDESGKISFVCGVEAVDLLK